MDSTFYPLSVPKLRLLETLANFGQVVFCRDFPSYTSPFWNMKKHGRDHAHKIDVIINGNETIGSAERSTSPEGMAQAFYTISKGKYAAKLFSLFSKERVEKELNNFLALDFFPRAGGGIGMTRMIDAMQANGLVNA